MIDLFSKQYSSEVSPAEQQGHKVFEPEYEQELHRHSSGFEVVDE